MKQVAVRSVNLDPLETQPCSAAGCPNEVVAHTIKTGPVEGCRSHFALRMRHGRGSFGLPTHRLVRPDLGSAVPRGAARGFAARMRELDGHLDRRICPDGGQDTGEGCLVLVGIETEIVRGDPSLGRDRRRFENHQAGARKGQIP
jgi:hypothetical protein